jgi:hypothetical protein
MIVLCPKIFQGDYLKTIAFVGESSSLILTKINLISAKI